MKKYVYAFAAMLCITSAVNAQFTIYDNTTTSGGLSDNFCWYVNVNSSNEVWVGTQSGGAFKYNGSWTNYANPGSGIASNFITPIMFDNAGRTWTGSYTNPGGLSRWNGSWTVYTPGGAGTIADHLITSLSQDASNDIWIAGRFNGVSRYNGSTFTRYNTGNCAIAGNEIYAIECEPSGNNVWVGTALYGLCLFNGSTWVTYNTGNSAIPGNNIYSLRYNASTGKLWVGTSSGLGIFDLGSNSWVVYNTGNSSIADDYIRGITFSYCTGDAWLATGYGGISSFDGTNWTNYTTINSNLPTNAIWSIRATPAFGIWASTWGGGVVRIGDCGSDLKVCMPFPGDAQDYSGNGNHGTVNGGVTLTTDRYGNSNSAYNFPGNVGDNISITNFASFIPNDELTVSIWGKSGQQGTTCLFMLDPDNSSDRCAGCAMYTGTGLIWDYGDISAGGRMTAGQSYDQNWHHYAYIESRVQNRQEIWMDGSLVASGPFVMGLSNRARDFFIGAGTAWNSRNEQWNGDIDDICIYNRGVSPSEVVALYHLQSSCCGSHSGGSDDDRMTSIGETTNAPSVKVYPNPGNGTLKISGVNESGAVITILNTEGKIVFTSEVTKANATINTGLPTGIYFYTVNGNGTKVSGKLLVQ